MSATAMQRTNRYFQPGITKVVLIDTIANFAAGPTRAELNAGTDVSNNHAAWAGWSVTTAQVATPDLGRRFTGNIGARVTADESSLTQYADLEGHDIREVVTRDQELFVAILDGGDVPGRLMDVFETTVVSVSKVRDLEDAPRLTVTFSISDFAEDLSVPAAV